MKTEQEKMVERWENALRVLRKMTKHQRQKHFDMSTWGEVTACGTVACLAGHCSLDPWFRRRGFKSEQPHGFLRFTEESTFMFFGEKGYWDILMRTRASYSEIVGLVKEHIKTLKAAA